MASNKWISVDHQDEKIRRLEGEVYRLRRMVVQLLPKAVADVLNSYHRVSTIEESSVWLYEIIDKVIELATLDIHDAQWQQPRAYCPLCKKGSSSPLSEGFTVPEGLRRHLMGYGNVARCDVMDAASEIARDYLEIKFRREREIAELAAQQKKELRRKSEQLYQIRPGERSYLRDESIWFKPARDDDSMAWAEKRLVSLGFIVQDEDGVRSYIRQGEGYIIFADPRASGRIEFYVFKNSPRAIKQGKILWKETYSPFNMQDSWKHDLNAKFDNLLKKCL